MPGHTRFFFQYFFFNPARFQFRVSRVPGRLAGPGRVSKLWSRTWDLSNLIWIKVPLCWRLYEIEWLQIR
jgi:hypothetical protein